MDDLDAEPRADADHTGGFHASPLGKAEQRAVACH